MENISYLLMGFTTCELLKNSKHEKAKSENNYTFLKSLAIPPNVKHRKH